jgi:hypothetical protein
MVGKKFKYVTTREISPSFFCLSLSRFVSFHSFLSIHSMSVRGLHDNHAEMDLRKVQFNSVPENTALFPPVEVIYARFLHLVQSQLDAHASDKTAGNMVSFPVDKLADADSIQHLIEFFKTHYHQMNKLDDDDEERGTHNHKHFAWMLICSNGALSILSTKRAAATKQCSDVIATAVDAIHKELPHRKDYYSYYSSCSFTGYDMEASACTAMPDVRNALPPMLKDAKQATVSLTALFPSEALCYLTKAALDKLDTARTEYHATAMLNDADLRVEYGGEHTKDCRLRHAVDSTTTPVCFLCRDWTVRDLPAAMRVLRTIEYLGVHPDLYSTLEEKISTLLNASLYNWYWSMNSSIIIISINDHQYLFQALGLSVSSSSVPGDRRPTTAISCTPQATIYSDESVIPDLSDAEAGSEDRRMMLAQTCVERRMKFVASVLHVSLDMSKMAMQSLLRRNMSSLHWLCDLLENALLSGYAITGVRVTQLQVMLEEPFKSIVLGLLRSILMPLDGNLEDQEKIWLRLHHEYQHLFWTKCRHDLIGVFGISPAHERHFREAPTLSKFVVWFDAGADTKEPIDDVAMAFQEETQDDKIKRQEEQRLQRLRVERTHAGDNGGGSSSSSSSSSTAAAAVTSTTTNAAQLQ